MKTKIILFSTTLLLLVSCFTTKKTTSTNFTKAQETLINQTETNSPMRVLLITNKEDSLLLRTKSEDIDLKDKSLKEFSEKLLATVKDPKNMGVGIAAPQVGILKNIIIIQRYDLPGFPYQTYLNPRIVQYSKKTQFCLEGCLSIPKRTDTTKDRAYAIMVEYDMLDGTHKIEMVEAFTAVIFQHEIDHLNGILYLDHLDLEIRDAEKRMNQK